MRLYRCFLLLLIASMGMPKWAGAEEKLTAWATYWEADSALEELERLDDNVGAIVFFAAYFDEDGALFIPDGLERLLEGADALYPGGGPERYLSVVNDQLLEDGGSSLKDAGLIKRLFATPESRERHAREILSFVREYGFGGIELDYEALRDDQDLWRDYLLFIELMSGYARTEGLSLRVLLEPSFPYDSILFPPGPEYVMMCYNLYGTHSGPGPKADGEFLRKLVQRMLDVPGEKSFALAGGGFDWSEDGVLSLTYERAGQLARQHGIEPLRDENSAAMHFTYREDGVDHEVWYADERTLTEWAEVIREMGEYGVNLWRLGGNCPEDAAG